MTDNTYIRHTPESGNVDKVQYFPEGKALNIQFKDGKIYQYSSVPPIVWEGAKAAKSIGSYIAVNIKGFFRYAQI